ncbi:MAG: YkgJ family cysteine cluster protein [Acidiferrobacterales bacterium]|jgi:Fe-S-cluster containining protein|nr:YkgJ family cysteine cluster protein [Acidiferrobacterales bacterium]
MRKIIPIAVDPESLSSEEKCGYCTNTTCCTYITQELDTPRSMEDFDTLLWQISHENVQAYKDEGDWYLLVNNRCRHILGDGRCGIYDVRPQICREHSNEDCEFNTPASDDDFDLYFPDYESLDAYCRKRFKSWDRRWDRFAKAAG